MIDPFAGHKARNRSNRETQQAEGGGASFAFHQRAARECPEVVAVAGTRTEPQASPCTPKAAFAPYPTGSSGKPPKGQTASGAGHFSADIIPFPQKRRPGRPSVYSEDLADEICNRIAEGGMRGSLRKVCEAPDMPGRSTILGWLRTDPAFRRRYELACEFRDDGVADEVVEIADATTAATVQRARLQIDVRKWWLAKVAPRKYDADRFGENAAPGVAEAASGMGALRRGSRAPSG
jgi:hypothetical protein